MASSSTPTATPRKRNPGRNLPAAFGTGIFLGGIVLFVVLGVPALTDNRLTAQLIWAVLVAILVVLALKEVAVLWREHVLAGNAPERHALCTLTLAGVKLCLAGAAI